MQTLTNDEMARLDGGLPGWDDAGCGVAGALTVVSCMTGMLWACAIGFGGVASVCGTYT